MYTILPENYKVKTKQFQSNLVIFLNCINYSYLLNNL